MMKKRMKKGSSILLALALAFSLLVLPGTQAANAVETDRTDCSIEFRVGSDYEELKTTDITVKLYRVASISESGRYTALDDFKNLDVSALDPEDSGSSADTWAKRAKDAEGMVTDQTVPAQKIILQNGSGLAQNLETGLYLVCTDKVITEHYVYTFTPYLISLPNNYYATSGDDTWIYSLTGEYAVGLKPEQENRYGDLIINKNLVNTNASSGENATFVFQIDITTPDGKTETRIEEITFDKAGQKSITISDIPAGSTVTVTEVYSGASYKLISENGQTVVIVATDHDSTSAPSSVSFTNEHDGRQNGGYGVKNNFKLDENDQYQYTGSAN